ncbi:MAG: ornithine cyclodeaminase [Rhodobacteraceae bacterium]|nr:ornithine cyclodeaminase [Paracoccaceae bacterium]
MPADIPVIGPEAEAALDWIALTDAIAAGHDLPEAQTEDVFLTRGSDTILTRCAWIEGLGSLVKTATVFPGNATAGKPTIGGSVSLFGDTDGVLKAYLDFALVTKWKTAADSLLAARRLARPDSRTILIVGAGTVGRSLREAYAAAFPAAEFLVWNRTAETAKAFAAGFDKTEAVADLEEGVRKADIVTSATMSVSPILKGEWFRPGQHVDLIGAYRADMREADDALMTRGRIFVDSRATTIGHIGELKDPIARGVLTAVDVVSDYYTLNAFQRAPEDITVFKNGGGAHLDLMTSNYILETWKGRG